MRLNVPGAYTRALMVSALIALLLGACASVSPGKGKDTRPAAERAADRAGFFVAGQFDKAWEFTTPGYRATVPQKNYVEKSEVWPIKWLDASVVDSDCVADAMTCEVAIYVEFQTQIPMPHVGRLTMNHKLTETWLKIDDVWYFLPPDFR